MELIARLRMLAMISNLALAITLLVACFILQARGLQQQAGQQNATSPYWHRPGCFLLGHTRTISIPGCVKFNLSTNACRGFCMSYSIPAVEDLGPSSASSSAPLSSSSSSPAERANALLEAGEASSDRRKAAQSAVWLEDKILREQLAAKSHFGPHEVAGAKVVPVGAGEREAGGRVVYPEQQQQLALGWGLPSTVSPGGGQTGERDVVSVSQCCNMMDTEDVVVNLRCGSNEIRRLVFKSAKTCQCHFCKHV